MPLSRKLLLMNLALIVTLGTLAVALVFGVKSMRDAVIGVSGEYSELRLIEQTMYHCSMARSQLADPDEGSSDAAGEIESALQLLREFRQFQRDELFSGAGHQHIETVLALQIEAQLSTLLEKVRPASDAGLDLAHLEPLDRVMQQLSRLAEETDTVGASHAAAERTVTAMIIVGVLGGLLVLGSLAASMLCYWSVMNPLKRLHRGVRRIASGQFDQRLDERASREFAELAADFNHMATELAALYTDLEKKVQSKSQELVRSERLASVGFLAAGVAHEINNPLNIMSGYAEMARGWVENAGRHGNPGGNLGEVREALEIIRQEAFRCKDITGKLLSLATTGDSERGDVELPRLIHEVASMLRGLRKYRDRALIVECDEGQAPVRASAAEIRQVLLNLMINALEASAPGSGEVCVECRRIDGRLRVIVRDNGVGMTPDVLERAFEPFFTTRRQQGNRGVGLGLSISHAIITSHGGEIRAESDGPGRGSRFIVELPVHAPAMREEAMAHAT